MFLRVLKITATGVNKFYRAYPDLVYGDAFAPHIDMFNHGVMDGVWHGEGLCILQSAIARSAAMYGYKPNLEIDHHLSDGTVFKGNFDQYLARPKSGHRDNSDTDHQPRLPNGRSFGQR